MEPSASSSPSLTPTDLNPESGTTRTPQPVAAVAAPGVTPQHADPSAASALGVLGSNPEACPSLLDRSSSLRRIFHSLTPSVKLPHRKSPETVSQLPAKSSLGLLKRKANRPRKASDMDCAMPLMGMAKSIITMLTAASMYEDEDLAAASPRLKSKDSFALSDAVDMNKSLDAFIREHDKNHPGDEETLRHTLDATLRLTHKGVLETKHPASHPNTSTALAQSLSKHSSEPPTLAQAFSPPVFKSEDPNTVERTNTRFEVSVVSKLSQSVGHLNDDNEAVACLAKELADKLVDQFDLSPDEKLVANFQCMLLRDVLLQGHMYLTSEHLLFFAYLPKKTDGVVHSSGLTLKTGRTPGKRLAQRWCVLKESTFSIYNSATDQYFPSAVIDLRDILRVEICRDDEEKSKEQTTNIDAFLVEEDGDDADPWFRIIMESRTYQLRASSVHAARQWVNLLKKQVFTSKQNGDHISVKIPLESIIEVEGSNMFDGVEGTKGESILLLNLPDTPMTIRARVTDNYAVDDWFFFSLTNGPEIYEELRKLVVSKETVDPELEPEADVVAGDGLTTRAEAVSRTDALVDPLVGSAPPRTTTSPPPLKTLSTSRFLKGNLLRKLTHRGSDVEDREGVKLSSSRGEGNGSPLTLNAQRGVSTPPEVQSPTLSLSSELDDDIPETAPLSVTRFHRRHRGWGPGSFIRQVVSSANIISHATSMWAAGPAHFIVPSSYERGEDDPYYVTSEEDRQVANQHFRSHFSLPDTARLVSSYYTHFQKAIPTYGKVYVGETEICFRSLIPGVNFLMILPFADVETCYKERGFRFGYAGLVLVIRGHEELFIEFSTSSARDDCELMMLKQMDVLASKKHTDPVQQARTEADNLNSARLQMYEDKLSAQAHLDVPIIMGNNPFFKLEVRPLKPYHFTLLTIGSRGDVQPYIALGKGLVAEGHRVTIATHTEFQSWIETHELGFAPVAGNPAELMSLMVTHGTMSVAFLKEASNKFRGWIKELLQTSWEACQGTDVLIESPSAMAGIHIAEALNIPYIRAFTMPWTKTRAYPHAFIVPEQKRGGSYNYLTHVMFEAVFWKGIAGQVNPWREKTLHLPRTNLDKMQQFKVPFLYNVSPVVLPPSADFPDWVRVTGYWFLDESDTYEPPEALLTFMAAARDAGKKLVYIGFGSIVVSDPKELTQAVVDAVVQSGVYCILNKGWSARLNEKSGVEVELPPLVYDAGAIPHDWLFSKIDAAIHHGGSGTTGASLRAGIPTVIKPFFGDQYFYGGRVQDMGAGVYLRKLNAKSLARAIKDVTTKTRIIEKAKLVGEQIRAENGVSTAIKAIYGEMEYARQLNEEKHKEYQAETPQESPIEAEGEASWTMVEQ